ncbi:hypothetical protein [Zobellia sp. 1_MG-2023]|nr:hypothetical protein [Zobellia sp. 1_MG-2023]MDO6818900.1 hypothetical protein [Zobellia sp. 1_MG-2023]
MIRLFEDSQALRRCDNFEIVVLSSKARLVDVLVFVVRFIEMGLKV